MAQLPCATGHVLRCSPESPPPMTAMGWLRNMGAAPSHTAQAEMPLFQKPLSSSDPGKGSRRATAPVAMMMESATTSFSSAGRGGGAGQGRRAAQGSRAVWHSARTVTCPSTVGGKEGRAGNPQPASSPTSSIHKPGSLYPTAKNQAAPTTYTI